jgi:hypothetical protein
MIGDRFNFEDVFFRDLTVCVLDTLEGQIKWLNRFTSGDVFVQVPFYYSLSGDERFLLDSFADDVVSENRFVELNTDMIPRGHLTMTGFNIKADEFANPNVWLRMVVENEVEIRKVLGKVRAVPVTVNYDLEILLSSELDTFKCSQSIMDTLWIYKFMYFEYNFLNIDAVILMPDTNSIEMAREKNLTSDNNIKLKVSFTVETYYPAFRSDRVNDIGYPQHYGTGMVDGNGFALAGGVSSLFDQPGSPSPNPGSPPSGVVNGPSGVIPPNRTPGSPRPPFVGSTVPGSPGAPSIPPQFSSVGGVETVSAGIGSTGSFYNTQGGGSPGDQYGAFVNSDFTAIVPRRSRWFNNILKSREKSGINNTNPNGNNISNRNPNGNNML